MTAWAWPCCGERCAARKCPCPPGPSSARCALGWGLFNLVEGLIDHHLLHVHHVTETENHLVWDVAFLASGLVLLGVGLSLIKSGLRDSTTRAVLKESFSRGGER